MIKKITKIKSLWHALHAVNIADLLEMLPYDEHSLLGQFPIEK